MLTNALSRGQRPCFWLIISLLLSSCADKVSQISGTVTDGQPLPSATVLLQNAVGQTLERTTTNQSGHFSFPFPVSVDLSAGYQLVAADTGMQAYYAEDHREQANITPVTTLVQVLAATQQGDSALDRRSAAIRQLENIGVLQSQDWFSASASTVNWEQMNQAMPPSGVQAWTDQLMADLQQTGELSQDSMFGFPQAHGGLTAARFADSNVARLMKGVPYQEQIRTDTYQGDESFRFALIAPVDGLNISPEGVISYTPSADAPTGIIQFQVQISNTKTGKGRILSGTLDMLETEVVAEGSIGPAGGQITNDWQDIILTVPANAVSETSTIRILRSQDHTGRPRYTVTSSVNMVLPTQLVTPPVPPAGNNNNQPLQRQRTTTSNTKLSKTTDPDWVVRQSWNSQFATLKDGVVHRTNRLKTGASCPMVSNVFGPLVECGWYQSAQLDSYCVNADTCRDMTPIMFVHGYQISGANSTLPELGGGGTWRSLRKLLRSEGYAIYEFRWRSNANFRDAAIQLADAIRLVSKETGKKVHLIAHSFGGLLSRTYLQGLANYGNLAYQDNVQSLVTLGTPHSGIVPTAGQYHGVDLPKGQDAILFAGCQQISCNEAGEPTPTGHEVIADVLADPVPLYDYFGTSPEGGKLIALLEQHISALPVNVLALIGLTVNRKLIGEDVYENGDALISFAGQRFRPTWGNQPTLHSDRPVNTHGHTIREIILGEPHGAVPGAAALTTGDFRGYRHAKYGSFRGSDWETNINSTDHPAFIAIQDWLASYTTDAVQAPEITLQLTVIDAATGSSVPGAQVTLLAHQQDLATSTTNNAGQITITVPFYPDTSYQATVVADNYRIEAFDQYRTSHNTATSSTQLGTLNLTPDVAGMGRINAKVVDAISDSPITGVNYMLTRNSISHTGETDATGSFTTDDLIVGTWHLTLSKSGYTSQTTPVYVRADETTTIEEGMITELTPGSANIRLNWGIFPLDLDVHLRRYTDRNEDYHLSHDNTTTSDASLHRDDKTGFGLEIVNIQSVSANKLYRYVVNKPDGLLNLIGTIADSDSVVTLVWQDKRHQFYPPNEPGTYWHVFDIVDGVVTPCQQNCMSANWPVLSAEP
jgi:pimeloyl-ACP methyl ester carboxylesterase